MTKPVSARIEVFRPGTFTPMIGAPVSYSAADLKAIADAYDPATAPTPIVIGHPKIDAPAYGWVESFDYDADAERLFANLHQIEPSFAAMVRDGRFKKVSMQLMRPDQAHNPVPGTWYPMHVGFLGAAAPAVSGLKNVAFAGDEGVTFHASFGVGEETASLLRRLRDLLIEKFSLEDADKALPSWQIEWLNDQDKNTVSPAYATPEEMKSAPIVPPHHEPEEPAVSQQPNPAFAEREAALAAREKALADREAEIAQEDNAAFAESLVQDGKLLPASKDKVVAILNEIGGEATVSFAAGAEKLTPVAALKEVLNAQPKIVSFGAMELPPGQGEGQPASFAADGRDIDTARLAQHNKALEYQRAHPGTDYIAAVNAVA